MTILEVYEKVNLAGAMEQRLFFNYLNDSITEACQMHGDMPQFLLANNITSADITPLKNFDEEIPLLPLYHDGLVDNIVALGFGGERKNLFYNKINQTYLQYWSLGSKGKRVKRERW